MKFTNAVEPINTEFLRPFLVATIKTLKDRCALASAPEGKPYLKPSRDPNSFEAEIAGILGISSQAFEGSISLFFSNSLSRIVAEKMRDNSQPGEEDPTEPLKVFMEVVLEFARRQLLTSGFTIDSATANAVSLASVLSFPSNPHQTIVIPFRVQEHQLHFSIATGDERAKL